jgi:pimeloyl-ACP methyl ester carboxylesterase
LTARDPGSTGRTSGLAGKVAGAAASGRSSGRRRASLVGAILGAAAAGIAAGVATERYVVRRYREVPVDPHAEEVFGRLPADEVRCLRTGDGVDLHVEIVEASERGGDDPAQDLTLVFAHGFCLDMGTFHFQRKALSGAHRMVFYDQPGHGRSGRLADGDYSLDALGEALLTVVECAAPTGRVVLIGHSMGGMAIMALAEQAPELFDDRVAGVIFIATSGGDLDQVNFGMPAGIVRFRRPLLPVLSNAGRLTANVVDRARRASTDLAWLLTRHYGFGGERPSPALVSYVEKMNSTTSTEVIARYLVTLYSHARLLALSILRSLPVLVICGEEDVLTPLSHSEEICRVLPDAQFVVFDEAGHMVMLERADEVNAVIAAFLDRVTSQ